MTPPPPDSPRPWLAGTRGIVQWRHVAAALGAPVAVWDGQQIPQGTPGVIGWGRKDNTAAVRAAALAAGVPWVTWEDGFIRSIGLGVGGAEPFGFTVDHRGVAYDATAPSELEELLADGSWTAPPEAARLRKRIVDLGIGKYNHCWEAPQLPERQPARPRLLLVDQTRGDLSVSLGLADEQSFARMLDQARRERPDAQVLVKLHPDVVAGRRRGYLADLDLRGCIVLSTDANPMALVQAVDEVWCVTSQLGLEALLAERPVRCFGMPAYAGWGLTRDEVNCQRRTRQRTIDELFWAIYVRVSRYVDPLTGQRCELSTVIERIADHRRVVAAPRQRCWALGFTPRKQLFIAPYAAPWDVRFVSSAWSARWRGARPGDRVLTWGFRAADQADKLAARLGTPVARMEDGFLRSVGLGSDLVRPRSLVVDDLGIYFDPQQPSRLERILAEHAFSADELARGAALIARLRSSGISKYNTGRRDALILPAAANGRRRMLVPGQVEDDQSILRGCSGIRTNDALLAAVRAAHPQAFVIAKPHPDVLVGNRSGASNGAGALQADLVVTDHQMPTCLAVADEVHTLTSLSGFEALIRGVPVTTYGLPFYAGWGLTTDRAAPSHRRGRVLPLEALVVATLVLYPRYLHEGEEWFCGPESIIDALEQDRERHVPMKSLRDRPMAWWRRPVAWIRQRRCT